MIQHGHWRKRNPRKRQKETEEEEQSSTASFERETQKTACQMITDEVVEAVTQLKADEKRASLERWRGPTERGDNKRQN